MKKTVMVLFSLLFFVSLSCAGSLDQKPNTTISHLLAENPYLDVAWSKNDIDIFVHENMSMLVTAPNRIFTLGINPYTYTVYAFDSVTGKLMWKQDGALPNTISANGSAFYTTNLNNIYAYNITNGDILWSNRLPYAGPLVFVRFNKDKIFAYSSNGTFFILNALGGMLESRGPLIYPVPYIVDDVTYASGNGIISQETKTGKVLWEADIKDTYYTGPLFLDDVIYVRTGDAVIPGNVYAVDKTNGEILWKNGEKVISNTCPLGSNLYFLTLDGYLIGVDQKNGQEVARIEFSPRPFNLPTGTQNVGGYYVAADHENNIVFVSLGDSFQLFALQIKSK
jgi:outer membrane protein assembly factor BamB